jgi:Zn finger protein HypA/HybF involved in hydrogenase expression
MNHLMNDEEFAEYNAIKLELSNLREWKSTVMKSAQRYFEKGSMFNEHKKVPCKDYQYEYECSHCPIGELLPDLNMCKCAVGQETNYSK